MLNTARRTPALSSLLSAQAAWLAGRLSWPSIVRSQLSKTEKLKD